MTTENKKQVMDFNMDYRFLKGTDEEFDSIKDILGFNNDNRSYFDSVYILKTAIKDSKTITRTKQKNYDTGYHYKLIIVNKLSDVLLVDYSDDVIDLISKNLVTIKRQLKKTF